MKFKKISFDRQRGFPSREYVYVKCLKCNSYLNTQPASEIISCICGNVRLDGIDCRVKIGDWGQIEVYSLIDDLAMYPLFIGSSLVVDLFLLDSVDALLLDRVMVINERECDFG